MDASGRFIRDPPRQTQAGDPLHIREEFAAQAGRFLAVFGRQPSHLDSHHHVHRLPGVFEAVLDLASWLGVALRAVSSEMAGRIRAGGLAAPDRMIGDVGREPYWTRERLLATLASLGEGVTELA